MRSIIIGFFALLMGWMLSMHQPEVKAYDYRDCEYFILNNMSSTHYTECLKNPYNYAHYFIYYNVTFYSDSTVLSSQSIRRGQDASAPLTPTKTSHTFLGWNQSFTNVQSNLTILATWLKSNQVTFLDYNGVTLKIEHVEQGGSATPPTVQARAGYEFTGWNGSYTNVTQDKTLMATYRALSYQVTYFHLDGRVYQTYTVPLFGTVTPPPGPVLEGKTFTQWSVSSQQVQSDLSIYPQYDTTQYRVRFYDQNQLIKDVFVPHGSDAIAPIMSKEGHIFAGWDQSTSNITSSRDLHAQWNKQSFDVFFYLPSGDVLSHQSIAYMEDAIPPTYQSAEGYQFSSWDTSTSSITKETHIHPLEVRAKYAVYFMDGDAILHQEDVFHGEACLSFIPIKEGHDFDGWSDNCDRVVEQVTIRALFIPHQYTVRFYDFLGLVVKEERVNHGQAASPPSTEFPNYRFLGWSTSFDQVTTDLTVHPLGEMRKYQAVFKNYEGTTLCTRIVEFDAVVSCPEPSKVGHRFVGWSESLTIKNDITIFAQFEPLMFQVDFYIDNVLAKREMVRYNFNAVPPQVNLKEYDFTAWQGVYQNVKSNQRVDAIISRKEYVVVFKVDQTTVKEVTVPHGQAAIPPITALKEGHEFVRWIEDYSNVTTHRAINAEFIPLEYRVTFLVQGSPYQTLMVPYMSDVIPPEVYVLGHELIGWQGLLEGIKENITITAILRPLTYLVTFIDNGDIISEQRVTHGQAAEAPFEAYWDQAFRNVTSHMTIQRLLNPVVEEELVVLIEEPIIMEGYGIQAIRSRQQDYERFTFEMDLRDYEVLNVKINGLWIDDSYSIRFQSTNFLRREVHWLEIYNPDQQEISFELREIQTETLHSVQPMDSPETNHVIQQVWLTILSFIQRFLR